MLWPCESKTTALYFQLAHQLAYDCCLSAGSWPRCLSVDSGPHCWSVLIEPQRFLWNNHEKCSRAGAFFLGQVFHEHFVEQHFHNLHFPDRKCDGPVKTPLEPALAHPGGFESLGHCQTFLLDHVCLRVPEHFVSDLSVARCGLFHERNGALTSQIWWADAEMPICLVRNFVILEQQVQNFL